MIYIYIYYILYIYIMICLSKNPFGASFCFSQGGGELDNTYKGLCPMDVLKSPRIHWKHLRKNICDVILTPLQSHVLP